jgi:hypothetical protein
MACALAAAHRACGAVSRRADRLTSPDAATRNPMLRRDIERLLDGGVPDPAEFIANLFTRAGVSFEADPSGIPRLH